MSNPVASVLSRITSNWRGICHLRVYSSSCARFSRDETQDLCLNEKKNLDDRWIISLFFSGIFLFLVGTERGARTVVAK